MLISNFDYENCVFYPLKNENENKNLSDTIVSIQALWKEIGVPVDIQKTEKKWMEQAFFDRLANVASFI